MPNIFFFISYRSSFILLRLKNQVPAMLRFIYDIFIFPIEFVMDFVLAQSIEIFGNYIAALISVSLCVGFGSLPFYHMAETWQDRERAIQKKLAPKIADFKAVYKGATLNSYIRTLYRQNHYHPVMAVRNSVGLLIQIPFFFAAYHLLSHFSGFNGTSAFIFKDLSQPDGLLKIGRFSVNIMPFVMTAINLVSTTIYSKKTSFKEKIQLYGIAFLFLVLLYKSPSALLFYWTCNNIFSLLKNIVYSKIYKNGVISGETRIGSTNNGGSSEKTQIFDSLFLLSALNFSLLAFIAVPLALMASGAKGDFTENISELLPFLTVFATVFSFTIYFVYKETSIKARRYLSVAAVSALFCTLLNVFLFTGDYGDMSHFVFENSEFYLSFKSWISTLLFAVFFVLLVLFAEKIGKKVLKPVLTVIMIALALFSINEARIYHSVRSSDKDNTIKSSAPNELPKYFTLTRTGQNVIVLMLDRFIGGYMPQILEFMPELKSELQGFTWYRNTLSQASYTVGGVPPILGGWDYTVYAINKRKDKKPLANKLDESLRVTPYNFNKAGFDTTLYTNANYFDKENKEFLGNTVVTDLDYDLTTDFWLKRHQRTLIDTFASTRKLLIAFGIFRTAPEWLRPAIYDDGKWHTILEEGDTNLEKDPDFYYYNLRHPNKLKTSLQTYASLDLYPEMSATTSEQKNKFYYITNMLPHEPYSIDSNFELNLTGNLKYPRKVMKKVGNQLSAVQHLYTDATAMRLVAKWLKWMKENGVYDNTRIIIVSDHGRNVYDPFFKKKRIPNSRKASHPAYFNNVILVKDFNAQGKIKTDNKFMTQASVPSIAMKGIIDGVNPYSGKPLKDPDNIFPFNLYDIEWRLEKQGKFKHKTIEHYRIEKFSDIKDPSKWKVIK